MIAADIVISGIIKGDFFNIDNGMLCVLITEAILMRTQKIPSY